MPSLCISHIQQAAARLRAVGAGPTPILRSDWVDTAVGCAVHFKSEHLQRTGSFKYRGATNAVAALDAAAAAHGVVCHSSGNHGAALARAAHERSVPCCVVVPHTTPEAKIANMRRYGARVVLCEPTQTTRTQTAEAEAQAMGGAAVVHPYNDTQVMAGQGTIGLELMEQLPSIDAVLVPVSGGGLIGGIAAAVKAINPTVRVIAVEPEGKRLQESLATATRVIDPATSDLALDTIADAIRTRALGPIPWDSTHPLLDPAVLSVSNAQIREAMRVALVEMKQAVEPAGALTLAAVLSPEFAKLKADSDLRQVVAVICGGNIDPSALVGHIDPSRADCA
jgi:threonine dehydratase